MMDKKIVLGVGITNATKEEILEYIVKNLENFKKKLFFVTPNPEFLVLASKNNSFKNILNRADLASADGIGVVLAAKILGKDLKGRFTGVDLVESLCEKVSEKPITVGFLGGRYGVADKTAECLRKKYPKLKIGFVGEEWPKGHFLGSTHSLKDSSEPGGNTSIAYGRKSNSTAADFLKEESNDLMKNSFREESRPQNNVDVLFVAFGAPKQEIWINENLEKIPVKIAIGVGGAFDYISGKIPRAPNIIRNIGLEWLFRLVVQPWRIKRQLALIKFAWLVFKEKIKNSRE